MHEGHNLFLMVLHLAFAFLFFSSQACHEAETYAHVKPTWTLLWGPTGTGKSIFARSVFGPARTFVMMFGDGTRGAAWWDTYGGYTEYTGQLPIEYISGRIRPAHSWCGLSFLFLLLILTKVGRSSEITVFFKVNENL